VRPLEAFLRDLHRSDARDAVDAHSGAAVRDEVPRARLEHEPERLDRALYDAAPLAVADAQAPPLPEACCDGRQVWDLVLAPEPAARVEVEQPRRPLGALLQLAGQRGEHLEPRVREHAAQAELRSRPDEERLGLVGGQSREPRPVAAGDAAATR